MRNLTFHAVDNDQILAFSKRDGDDIVIVILTLDPFGTREATVTLDMPALGMDWHDSFRVRDEVGQTTFVWRQHNYVRLDPHAQCAHILHVRRGAA